MSFLGKTENTEISFAFFAELLQSASLCHRLSKKLNFIKIWQVKVGQNKDLVCYRQKQSFRQCAWGLRQFKHFNSYLNYVNKTTGIVCYISILEGKGIVIYLYYLQERDCILYLYYLREMDCILYFYYLEGRDCILWIT